MRAYDHLRAELPLAALRMAISAQRPNAGLIHHCDRGVQYASADYRKLMQATGLRASMSRKGDCYDNAPMESFFHTLKTQLVHHRHYETRGEATRDLFVYIEGFYNRIRRHSAIGFISPIEMELKAA
jgi:putative transposase